MAKRSRSRSRKNADQLAKEGQQAFDSRNYLAAIQVWEKLKNKAPTKLSVPALAEAYFRRSLQTLAEQADSIDAESLMKDLQRAVDLLPSEMRYVFHLGLAAQRQGDLETAVSFYRKARQQPGEFADRAAYPLAVALLMQGEDPTTDSVWASLSASEKSLLQAAGAFQRRPYTIPDGAPSLLKALAALDEEEFEVARSLLQQDIAARSPSEAGLVHHYLGAIAAQEEDWELAVREWHAAEAAGFESPNLTENLVEALHRLAEESAEAGDISGALAAAEEAAEYGPPSNALQELLSHLYQHQGYQATMSAQWEQAQVYWEKAYDVSGGSFRLAYNQALTYEQTEDFYEAAEAWRDALRRRPRRADNPDAITEEEVSRLWRRAAESYVKAGEFDEAVQVCKTAVKWNPDSLDARMMLAEGLYHNGRLQAAENELERILEKYPDHIPTLLLMAEATTASDAWWQTSNAIYYWSRVLELEPENVIARQGLVDHYLDEAQRNASWGGFSDAISLCEKALEVSPGHPGTLALLGAYHLQIGDSEPGKAYLQQALECVDIDWAALSLICEVQLREVSEDAFMATLEHVEATNDDVPFAMYLNLALVALSADAMSIVEMMLDRAVDSAPETMPIFSAIGKLLSAGHEVALATSFYERALKAGEPPGPVYEGLVLLALRDDDTSAARRYLRRGRRAARRADDSDMMHMLDELRSLLDIPPGLLRMFLMSDELGIDPFGMPLGGLGLDDEYEDDDDLFY